MIRAINGGSNLRVKVVFGAHPIAVSSDQSPLEQNKEYMHHDTKPSVFDRGATCFPLTIYDRADLPDTLILAHISGYVTSAPRCPISTYYIICWSRIDSCTAVNDCLWTARWVRPVERGR